MPLRFSNVASVPNASGGGGKLTTPYTPAQLNASENFTLAFWFRDDKRTPAGTGNFFFWHTQFNDEQILRITGSATTLGKLRFYTTTGSIDTVSALLPGRWYHYLVTRCKGSEVRVYLDGRLEASNLSASGWWFHSYIHEFGSLTSSICPEFMHVGLWRQGCGQAEAKAIANGECAYDVLQPRTCEYFLWLDQDNVRDAIKDHKQRVWTPSSTSMWMTGRFPAVHETRLLEADKMSVANTTNRRRRFLAVAGL